MEPEDFIAGEHSDAVRPMLAFLPRGPKLEPEAEESDTEDADELDECASRHAARPRTPQAGSRARVEGC